MEIVLTDLSGAKVHIKVELIQDIKPYRTCRVISLALLGCICVKESVDQIKAKMFGGTAVCRQ